MPFMVSVTTTTTPNSYLFSSNQTIRRNPFRKRDAFFSFSFSSKSLLLSKNSTYSTSLRASTLLATTSSRKMTNYDAEICKLCEMGKLRNAMNLLCSSPNSQLDVNTYCSVLQLCAEMKSLEDGKKVHSIIKSYGVSVNNDILGSKLVFMYLTCGDLEEGRRIFDEIGSERVFIWNQIINEYAKVRDFSESISLFRQMVAMGVQPNPYTFSNLFKCFASLECFSEGEEAHGYLVKLGFASHNRIGNGLISFYSKCKKMESARKVFDEMDERDVVSWNSMISGYSSNSLTKKGLQVFSLMRSSGVEVDLATMLIVFQACTELGVLELGKVVHGYVIKSQSIDRDITLDNCLLDMYAKCGDITAAEQVFQKMDKKNVVTWTAMLSGYARHGQCDTAVYLFREMEIEGVEPDLVTVTSILHACKCNESLDNGKDVHDYIISNGLESNLFVANALMDMYAKCGSMEDAQLVFDGMPTRDVISWNTMIGGYAKNCLPEEAFRLFTEMQLEFKPNGVTIACILPVCAMLSSLDRGKEIHGYVLRNRFSYGRFVGNALIDMYNKCGALVLAQSLFDTMHSRDLVSWTVMIAGYGMHGRGKDAISLFKSMRKTEIEPDGVAFIGILYACSHAGLVDEGWKFYNMMKNEFKIEPTLEHYACMVDLLARAGRLKMAYKFIEEMPIEPDGTIWGALLSGCRAHRDVRMAEDVAEKVFDLEPENAGYYVLLANIYSEAEKWEEVKKLRERMGQRGLKKNPGCSWIEMNSKLHVFVSGDRSHPQSRKIDSLLASVRSRMEEEGCPLNKKYALINASDMEKVEALCEHSEKLAMAYGILSLPPGMTVRVTKNLRVCSDCHEMAKFMSKMFETEIVLRDSNRFHQFKDGHCSCRGYW